MEIFKCILVFGIIPICAAAIMFAASTWSVNKLLADAEQLRQKRLKEQQERQGSEHQNTAEVKDAP